MTPPHKKNERKLYARTRNRPQEKNPSRQIQCRLYHAAEKVVDGVIYSKVRGHTFRYFTTRYSHFLTLG